MSASALTFSAATSTLILAADEYRDYVLIQLHSSANSVYLGFGEAAVDATGIALMFPGDCVKVRGPKARKAIYGIDAGASAVLGIETKEEVEYVSGQFAGPWPAS